MASSDGVKRGSVLWLTLTSLLMAMNVVLSMSVLSVPVPGGHLYFNDAVINAAAILMDPVAAFVVGGISDGAEKNVPTADALTPSKKRAHKQAAFVCDR